MASNGTKKRRTDARRSPKIQAARALQDQAKKALAAATRAGDQGKIERAQQLELEAAEAMRIANIERFERIAKLRTDSATRAIDELARAAMQRRYSLTEGHALVIADAIEKSLGDLKTALAAAVARSRSQAGRRSISFAPAGPLMVNEREFFRDEAR